MFGVGLLYLIADKNIVKPAKISKDDLSKVKDDGFSRTVLGAQVYRNCISIWINHSLTMYRLVWWRLL